jgi:peptidoglycan/xylan/chitin deacetylase (PgdA/CDA1 family)
MRYLRDNGYTTLTMRDAALMIQKQKPLPPHPVVLTFDDGYRDFYTTVAPVLSSLGLAATDYVPTRMVELPAFMTWSQIQELDAQGFEMAAHTEFHVALARASAQRAREEIFGSKSDLESHLGHPVYDFCYPFGSFSSDVVALVRQAGYQSATTTVSGGWHDPAQMLTLTRIRVSGGESLESWVRSLAHS